MPGSLFCQSGDVRYDFQLYPREINLPGIIIEVKISEKSSDDQLLANAAHSNTPRGILPVSSHNFTFLSQKISNFLLTPVMLCVILHIEQRKRTKRE